MLFATGDNGDAGEDGRQYAQDPANHLSKILRIDPSTSVVTLLAVGVRNVQRLFVNPNGGDPRLEFADLGGAIAEEFNSVRLADLLAAPVENFGWGRSAGDNLAREGTFYIDPAGAATGAAPTPEAGFVQPVAQFGREGAAARGRYRHGEQHRVVHQCHRALRRPALRQRPRGTWRTWNAQPDRLSGQFGG